MPNYRQRIDNSKPSGHVPGRCQQGLIFSPSEKTIQYSLYCIDYILYSLYTHSSLYHSKTTSPTKYMHHSRIILGPSPSIDMVLPVKNFPKNYSGWTFDARLLIFSHAKGKTKNCCANINIAARKYRENIAAYNPKSTIRNWLWEFECWNCSRFS